jgi:signal peptidase I
MPEQSTNQTRVGRGPIAGALLLSALIAALAFRYKIIVVLGESMRPTFSTGDIVLVDRYAYRSAEPERGDLVVARTRGDLIIKRIVGVPGDEVSVVKGVLHVDGVAYPESGINPGPISINPGVLGNERFALLGDNRALPEEQIVHAVVPKPQILGQVIFELHVWSGKPSSVVAIAPTADREPRQNRISNAFRT